MSSKPQKFKRVVEDEHNGWRLDQYLAAVIPELSRRKARSVIDIGGVFVARKRVKVAGRKVRRGQEVVVSIGAALERGKKEQLPQPTVLHRDDDLVVIDKPAGLHSVPTAESDRYNAVASLHEELGVDVHVVHRLDMPTSGVMVFALSQRCKVALSEMFRVHDLERSYEALVCGVPTWDTKEVDAPVGGKSARTHLRVLRRYESFSMLQATLDTGRTHQIRIHCKGLNLPVAGDGRYGDGQSAPRLMLHARSLAFKHPHTHEAMHFAQDWPAGARRWLSKVVVPARS